MRITITHTDPAASSILVVEDADGNTVLVPPGKARTVHATPPFVVREGEPFPGWDEWNALFSPPPPPANPDLPVIRGKN